MILLACTVLALAAAPSSQPVDGLKDAPISPEQKVAYNAALAEANRLNAAGYLQEQLRTDADKSEKAQHKGLQSEKARARQDNAIAKKAGPAAELQAAGSSFAQGKVHAQFGQMKKAYAAYRSGLRSFAGGITPLKGSLYMSGSLTSSSQNVAKLHGECVRACLQSDLAATGVILQACRREITKVDELAQSGGAAHYVTYSADFTDALKAAESKLAKAGIRLELSDAPTGRPATSAPARIASWPAGLKAGS